MSSRHQHPTREVGLWRRVRHLLAQEDGSIASSAGYVTVAALASASVLALVLSTAAGATSATHATAVDGTMTVQKTAALAELMGDELADTYAGADLEPARASGVITPGDADAGATIDLTGGHEAWGSREVSTTLNAQSDESSHVTGFDTNGTPLWDQTTSSPTHFRQISAAGDYACGIDLVSQVWCWGSNSNAQLGTGDRSDYDVPTALDLVGGQILRVTELADGTEFSMCAIEAGTGALWCWGNNTAGQLGSSTGYVSSPMKVDPGPVTQVAQSDNTTCAIGSGDGQLRCYGLNSGQADEQGVPSGLAGLQFTDVALDHLNAYALQDDGTVWVWSLNSQSLVGSGAGTGSGAVGTSVPTPMILPAGQPGVTQSSVPETIDGLPALESLHVAPDETGMREAVACGLTPAGQAWCWGPGAHTQLGREDSDPETIDPLAVSGSTRFVDLAVTTDTTCGIATTGSVFCWGADDRGQMGNGSAGASTIPRAVSGLPGRVSVLATGTDGSKSFCAATESSDGYGEVYCWGDNTHGQVGRPASQPTSTSAYQVPDMRATYLAMGDDFTCAATELFQATCWGRDQLGQLGSGAAVGTPVETQDAGFLGENMVRVWVR